MTQNALPKYHSQKDPHDNLVGGVIALFAEIVISVTLASLVKQISSDISVITILFCRYLFCLPLLICLGWHQRGVQLFQINAKKILAKRIGVGMMGLCSWFMAVIYLPLSLATVLSQLLTIFITLLAPFMLAEKVGIRRITAALIGFFGVLILINPFSADNQMLSVTGLIFGLAAPFFAALMFVYLRKLGRTDSPVSTSLWYNGIGTLVFGGLVLFTDAQLPQMAPDSGFIWMVLIITGVASSFQQFLMAWSHQMASASALAPVHYSAVPLSIFSGYIFFQESLNISFIAGTAVIMGSAWYILKRAQQKNPE